MTREDVLDEARSWIGTPYAPGQMVKGAGVDCGMLLIGIFRNVGHLDPGFDPRPYPIQWHFHQAGERYLGIVEKFAWEITSSPLPGDIVLFKFGKCFSHGAVVIKWPLIIHALRPYKVGHEDALRNPKMAMLERKFFTVFGA